MDIDTKKTGFWTRLNDQPLSTLPDSEGAGAKKQFEQISRSLITKKQLLQTHPFNKDSYRARDRYEISLFVPSLKKGESEVSLGSYIVKEGPYAIASQWSFWGGDFMFSNSLQTIFYTARCRPQDQQEEIEDEVFKLPMDYSGVFFIDWDKDGDEDMAILLKSGRYLFFEQNQCCEECIA